MTKYTSLIAGRTNIPEGQVDGTIRLLEEGCTIPFISRYRKEVTSGLNEVQIASISDLWEKFKEMDRRKNTILHAIEEQGKLTEELRVRIEECYDATELEDIYLPYKPKRRNRAETAREKGLEPLARILMKQDYGTQVMPTAERFVNEKKGVANVTQALAGARDIMAEWISESENARNTVRHNFRLDAVISSRVIRGKEGIGEKYSNYFDFSERLSSCPSHRLLAIRRGENEGILRVSIDGDTDRCKERLFRIFIKGNTEAGNVVQKAVEDSYSRLLKPSIETEFANESKERADEEAIAIFTKNLRQLLLAAPLGQKRVMGIDPGFRTGCKVVCLDAEGNLLHHEAIYPHPPKEQVKVAAQRVLQMVEQYKVEAISIGNGTAGRETEDFIRGIEFPVEIPVFMVSEDGASIYSASKLAREEFPDYDVTVRGAVSIARRLMDPLAELVKIDPKSIGVGQYQYDVNQTALKHSLDQTVEYCVNLVGVNVNTAGKQLLTYVSGLGPQLAQNIVDYRAKNGAFTSRRQLLKVSRMGEKSYEQCAGFLRITGSKNPLDNSAVHPERYRLVERMAIDTGCTIADLMTDAAKRKEVDIKKYVSKEVGLPTLEDIMRELEKPGRDPRKQIEVFSFDPNIKELADVRVGMVLPGIVMNITNFGCFVDVGVHTQGLVHISQIANRYVKDPNEVVSLHQHVTVKVTEVDVERQRLSLSMIIE